jgi:hypothetical protein
LPAVTIRIRQEYRFDYGQSRPNRFARDIFPGEILVVLDPDVAEVFDPSQSVNELLRSVMAALPGRPKGKRRSDKAPQPTAPEKKRRGRG